MSIEIGNVVDGVVTGITNFGAFIELPEGKTGLVHISEVADEYVKDVHDFLAERDKVRVKVLTIDDRGKIGLSIKQTQEAASTAERSAAPADAAPMRAPRPPRKMGGRDGHFSRSFEEKLSHFLKDSDQRMTDLRRKTDSKRGGRGSRRA